MNSILSNLIIFALGIILGICISEGLTERILPEECPTCPKLQCRSCPPFIPTASVVNKEQYRVQFGGYSYEQLEEEYFKLLRKHNLLQLRLTDLTTLQATLNNCIAYQTEMNNKYSTLQQEYKEYEHFCLEQLILKKQ